MLMVTNYQWRADAHTRDAGKTIMDVFGRLGAGPGEIAHYVYADGSGGVIVADVDDVGPSYRNALAFAEYLDLDVTTSKMVLTIDDALPHVVERMAG